MVLSLTNTAENAVNITAIRQTHNIEEEVTVFKIPKSKINKMFIRQSKGVVKSGLTKNMQAWIYGLPITLEDCEVFKMKPTFTLPEGVEFIRQGNKSGFSIDPAIGLINLDEITKFLKY
jgi:hypothetical protein